MNMRQTRLGDTWDAIGGPLARLGASLHLDRIAVLLPEQDKGAGEALATDAFLQRFNQVTDIALRNRLVDEYAMSPDERASELEQAWHAAERLRAELLRIKGDPALAVTLFGHD